MARDVSRMICSSFSVGVCAGASVIDSPVGTPIAVAERLLILATLAQLEGDKKKAASALQISLNTLYSRLNEYKGH